MRVGIVCYKYPLYEKGSYLQEFIDALASKCDEVLLISARYPDKEFSRPVNMHVKWVPLFTVPVLGDIIFNLFVFVKGAFFFKNVNLINVFSARPAPASFLLGLLLRKPVVCTVEIINEAGNSFADSIFSRIQQWIYSLRFNAVICWSKRYFDAYFRDGLARGRPNMEIIPAGIDTNRFNPGIDGTGIRKRFPAESFLVVFAKPMYEYNRKMAELLLDVIDELGTEIDIRLLLGTGEQRGKVEKKVRDLRLDNRVSFMPFVPITDIPAYIAASDFIVLPFTYQPTTSRSLLESLAMGKAVVTTNCGEIPRMVTNGEDALLAEPDKDSLASAVRMVCASSALRDKLGKNAALLAKRNYSVDSVIDRTIRVYKRVINVYHDK